MKKVLLLLIITLTLALSGCEKSEYYTECKDNGGTYSFTGGCDNAHEHDVRYYTQEEVDELLLSDIYVEPCFDDYYCICNVREEPSDYCQVIAFNNGWDNDLEELYDFHIEENEQDIVELYLIIETVLDDIESNDGYIENTYVNHNELLETIAELEARIEELEGE